MTDRDRIVGTLNDLIHIVEDSHEGYRQAAEGSADDDLKALFNDLGAQRGAIVRELQRLVAEQGGAPDMGGTVMGGAHRAFVGLKSAVLGRDRAAIFAEVQRGEAECVRRFEAALAGDLPQTVKAVIAQHLERIRVDYGRMDALRGAVA